MVAIHLAGLMILGWFLGIVINYFADVLPETRRLSPAPCRVCSKKIDLNDYALLRRCKNCHSRRSIRAWAVVFIAILITAGQWFYPSVRLGFWLGSVLLTYFGVVAVIDIEHRLILHPVSAAGAVLCFGIGVFLHGLTMTLLGGLAGFAMMMGLYLFGWLLAKGLGKLRGQAIEEDALGFGDIILCSVLGLLLGWPSILLGVVYTIFIAGAGSLFIIVWQLARKRYQAYMAVAFGPYLLLAAIVLLYWPK